MDRDALKPHFHLTSKTNFVLTRQLLGYFAPHRLLGGGGALNAPSR